jgi:hypothetical protein
VVDIVRDVDHFAQSATFIADARYPTVATAITPVATQPNACQVRDTVNGPRMRGSRAMSISSTITGTATIPLITATQTKACIALTDTTFATAPSRVAAAIVP